MDPMTRSFVAETERYAKDHGVPLIQFKKGERNRSSPPNWPPKPDSITPKSQIHES